MNNLIYALFTSGEKTTAENLVEIAGRIIELNDMKNILIKEKEPRELGNVKWGRDYDEALAKSKITGKPIFLLFQEVPGCITCVNFGINALSYPLMVEAIENEFTPLFIYNNKKGKDERVLKKFNEPSWNNPVVYFLNHEGENIVPKLDNDFNPISLYTKMINSLKASNREIPDYVNLLEADLKMKFGFAEVVYYETPCFWSGETSMMQQDGVLSTEAGWIKGKEGCIQ